MFLTSAAEARGIRAKLTGRKDSLVCARAFLPPSWQSTQGLDTVEHRLVTTGFTLSADISSVINNQAVTISSRYALVGNEDFNSIL